MTIMTKKGAWCFPHLIFLFAAIFAFGAVPAHAADNFDPEVIGNLVVLPIVDERIDKSKDLKLDKKLYTRGTRRHLKKKRYEFTIEMDPATIASVSSEGIKNLDGGMIARLGPDGSRWMLVFVLHESESQLSLGSAAAAAVTGYIIDKETRSILWQNMKLGSSVRGGIFGMLVKGMMQEEAVLYALDNVMKELPKRAKRKKRK